MAPGVGAKFLKKLARSKAKLEKEGFVFSEVPTKYVIIGNAGVANGVKRHDLEDMIIAFETLLTPAKKSYAMVRFSNEEVAGDALKKLQGYVLKSEQNLATGAATFYAHFVESFLEPHAENGMSNSFHVVPGLQLVEDFISCQEESSILNFLAKEYTKVYVPNCGKNTLKNRQVLHYGYDFRYEHSDVDPCNPLPGGLPNIFVPVIKKMSSQGLIDNLPDQITINKYEPGHGIPPHIDNPDAFDKNLASLSLGSQTVMDFRKDDHHVEVVLLPRSLVSFKEESRFCWTHGICPRKVDLIPSDTEGNVTPVNRATRYSVTFRRVRDDYKGPSKREFAINSVSSRPENEKEAEVMEELHVRRVYNEIASHFTATREKPWPKVISFLFSLEPYSLILDVGCGSGRYLGVRKDVQVIGCDKSENLVDICKDKGHEVFSGDGLCLPLNPTSVDACICIAVIHHYSTVERRIKAIEQLLKVTKTGGKILISVWAMEQEYKRVKSKYLKKISGGDQDSQTSEMPTEHTLDSDALLPGSRPEQVKSIPVHKNRTPFQQQDVFVPWHRKVAETNGSERRTFHRFYHVFKKDELNCLCRQIDGADILDSYYDEGNWCIILRKL